MKIWIVLTVLTLAVSGGNDTFNLFEDLIEKTDRQTNVINFNILAIFAVSIVTSLLANVLLGESSPGSNRIGILQPTYKMCSIEFVAAKKH